MKCPYCGKEVPAGSKFCDGCGAKLEAVSQPETTVSPDAFNYQGGYQPAPKKKTGLIVTIIIVSVLLIAGIIVGIILLTGGKKDDNNSEGNKENIDINENNENVVEPSSDLKVKYTEYTTDRNRVVLVVKNTNSKTIDVDFEISYYDDKDVIVGRDTEYITAFPANAESAIEFHEPEKEYDHYKITYKTEKTEYSTSHFDDVEVEAKDNKEDEEFELVVKNSSKETIGDLTVAIVFYRNGKVVGYSYDFDYDVPAGESILMTIDYPFDSDYHTIDFDDYKVYVVEAYSSKYSMY